MRNLRMVLCFENARGRLAVFSLALLVVSISALWLAPAASAASKAPAFGREVIVDHQRVAGEPSISIDSQDRIYVAAPFGFSTTASFVWRSTDHGRSFHLVPGDLATFGKPTTCVGGGDSALAVDTRNRLYFGDLQGLTNVSNSVSSDQGATWLTTCNAANAVGVDRPWIATFGDPQAGGALYQTVDQIGQCVGACDQSLGEVGANIVEITRSQDGVTFSPLPAQQIEPDGIVSGIVTDSQGGVYIAHTGLVDDSGNIIGRADVNSNDNAVVVVRFPNGYQSATATQLLNGQTLCQMQPSTCTTSVVYRAPLDATGNSTVTVGQDFSPIAIDRAGNLYVTWSQATVDSTGNISGSSQIYMAVSTDHGAHWGSPVRVTAATPSLQTNLFPWIAAGDAGRVDIVWYGTPTLGSCPNEPCGAGFIHGSWDVYMAQTLNAITNGQPNGSPSFATTKVSEYPAHFGTICEFGLACTTGGDRGLLDFLQVQADPSGAASVVWADGANDDFNGGETSAVIDFAQQIGGPGLTGGTVRGSTLSGSAPGSPAAYYAANGAETAASPGSNMRIVSSSVAKQGQYYNVTMKVGSLASLAPDPTLGGSDLIWLTRWELPNSHPTTASQGHFFYAAMESNAGGPPTFYDGDSICGVASTHCKFLTYPPAHTVTGSYTSSGAITIKVPIADVGGSGSLYSVTGLTATQTEPSTTGASIFNVIDSTPPYDVK